MSKVCDCGVLYADHLRCIECWLLLHTEEKYCHIYNSPAIIGFTVNGIRCFECIPGSNKNKDAEAKQKRGRKPLDPAVKELRRTEKEALQLRIKAERKKKRYQNDIEYREKIKKRDKKRRDIFNNSFPAPLTLHLDKDNNKTPGEKPA